MVHIKPKYKQDVKAPWEMPLAFLPLCLQHVNSIPCDLQVWRMSNLQE